MGKKRVNTSSSDSKPKQQKRIINEYNGYYPTPGSKIQTIKLSKLDPDQFFHNYVQTRTPVIIDGTLPGLDISKFQPDKIMDTLHYDEDLLVEKKFKGGFGSGTQRIRMKFNELMKKMKTSDDYYLTTQYVENEPSIEEGGEKFEEDEESEEDEEQEGFDIPNGDVSDTDSIDMNDIHDDFDEVENDFDDEVAEDSDEPIVSNKFPNDPLYESEAIRRVKELVQRPLTNLIKDRSLPIRPKILDRLATQQINLWMGSTSNTKTQQEKLKIDPNASDLGLGRQVLGTKGGVSSGLHHDHSDNLYVPIKGSKRFTIFAPSDGINLYTVGDIKHIFKSGVIDYENNENAPGWREVRDDGALVTEVAKWRLDNEKKLTKHERDELIKLIEDEENQLDNEDDVDVDNENNSIKKDPPSFSKIPAAIIHLDKITDEKLRSKLTSLAQEKWPNFFQCVKLTIDLKPGQMFYLPSGWFHEVTSFGDSQSDNIHIALNYWYSPPNGDERAYKDKYWKEDFQRTKESCELFKQGEIKL